MILSYFQEYMVDRHFPFPIYHDSIVEMKILDLNYPSKTIICKASKKIHQSYINPKNIKTTKLLVQHKLHLKMPLQLLI